MVCKTQAGPGPKYSSLKECHIYPLFKKITPLRYNTNIVLVLIINQYLQKAFNSLIVRLCEFIGRKNCYLTYDFNH